MSIKTLHRIYFGFDGKPDPYRGYLASWAEQLPDYEIRHWDATNLPLDQCAFSRLMFKLKDHAFLSDYFRWWILREHGGIYLDADIEVVNGRLFDSLVDDLEADPSLHAIIGIDNMEGGWYTGHSMASKKGGDLASFMCEVYEGMGHLSLWRRKIFYFMAPQLTSLYFATRGWNVDGMGSSPGQTEPVIRFGVKIYPQEYFSPMTPNLQDGVNGFVIDALTDKTALCHHFSCSWHDSTSPYRNTVRDGTSNTRVKDLAAAYGGPLDHVNVSFSNRAVRISKAILRVISRAPQALARAIRNA